MNNESYVVTLYVDGVGIEEQWVFKDPVVAKIKASFLRELYHRENHNEILSKNLTVEDNIENYQFSVESLDQGNIVYVFMKKVTILN